jgi:hypothetical protein
MATVGAFLNAIILVDGNDMSADMNEVTLDNSVELLDSTTFGDTARRRVGGLEVSTVTASGYYNAGSTADPERQIDATLFDLLGDANTVVTIYGTGVQEGSFNGGYALQTVQAEYSFGGGVGAMLSFDATFESQE